MLHKPVERAHQNLEGKLLALSLQHPPFTKFNIVPTGKENIFKGLISIFTEQTMKNPLIAEKQ